MKDKIQVLHIGNNYNFLQNCSNFLEKKNKNIEYIIETNPKNIHKKIQETGIDCIVSDYQMSEINGIELLKQIGREHGGIPFILFTDTWSEKIASKAISLGVTDYIIKGVENQYKILADSIKNEFKKKL